MTTSQQPPEDRAQGSTGLWQIIDMVTDSDMPRGEIELRGVTAAQAWRALREQARDRLNRQIEAAHPDGIASGRFEVRLPPYTQPDRVEDMVPARRFLEQLTVRDICHDPLVLDVETACQMPPHANVADFGADPGGMADSSAAVQAAFDSVTIGGPWMSYDSLRDLIGGSFTTEFPASGTVIEQAVAAIKSRELLQRVEAARREVAIMTIALDNGADPCDCGSWEVTWATALDRWICSNCADDEAEDAHEEDDARIGEQRGMQGITTDLCIYDEICGMPTGQDIEDALGRLPELSSMGPAEHPEDRLHRIQAYWRMGLDIVNPADHIRITGV